MPMNQLWMRNAACAAAAVALAACSGSKDATKDTNSVAETAGDTATTMPVVQDVAMRTFNGDKAAAVAGRQAFLKYNCYGCHGGLAGGAMGPSLRDDEWKYGGTDEQILNTLHQGRPAGMPAWKGVASEAELKNIVTYIRSMRSEQEPTFFFSVNDTTTHAGTLER